MIKTKKNRIMPYALIKIKLNLLLAVSIMTLLFISACSNKIVNNNKIITDMDGNVVEIPCNIERVACISQSATDLMIGFGLGDKIVGTYRSFLYNPWVYEIYPKSKDFKSYAYSVSAEELLKDKIQLVIMQDTENADSIRKAGIPVIAIHQYAKDKVFDTELFDVIKILTDVFPEIKDKSDKWVRDLKTTIEEVNNVSKSNGGIVYYVNGEKAKGLYYSDGGNSVISYLLGIVNMQLATEKYNVLNVHKVSDEEMINLNPDYMIIGGAYQNHLLKELEKSVTWSSLDCVKKSRVYQIPVCMVGIENVSIETPILIKCFSNIFGNTKYNINKELKDLFNNYFNYNLSNDDIDNMLHGLSKDSSDMIKD